MAKQRLNAEWHRKHRMPKNPTPEQRLRWHEGHAKACACREMPPAMWAELQKRASRRPLSRTARPKRDSIGPKPRP
jgi:hypothetical protein